ncbi:MAG: hypothetical protein HY553_20605 [Elusimicrobia bacterium]|nr:hypothetical protein [Elusimicrobiota bacterium]
MRPARENGRRGALWCGALLLAGALPAGAYAPSGYPGSAWARGSRNFDGIEGTGTQGWVRQGVRWLRFGRLDLNTYAGYAWRFRTQERLYYNVHGPLISAVLEHGPISAGAEYTQQRYPELRETQSDVSVFGSWYWSLDLRSRASRHDSGRRVPLGLPFSTWGRVDTHPQGIEGNGTMGWVRQGVDWFTVFGWTCGTYGMYNWRLRTQNQLYYNAIGPSAGVSLARGGLEIGIEHLWQRHTELRRSDKTFNLYLSWFYGWELKRPAAAAADANKSETKSEAAAPTLKTDAAKPAVKTGPAKPAVKKDAPKPVRKRRSGP